MCSYQPPFATSKSGKANQLKGIVESFVEHQDYVKAFRELRVGGWLKKYNADGKVVVRSKEEMESLKEHVRFT